MKFKTKRNVENWQCVYAVTSVLQDFSVRDNKQAQGKKRIDVYNLTNFHKEKVRKDLRHSKRNTERRLD